MVEHIFFFWLSTNSSQVENWFRFFKERFQMCIFDVRGKLFLSASLVHFYFYFYFIWHLDMCKSVVFKLVRNLQIFGEKSIISFFQYFYKPSEKKIKRICLILSLLTYKLLLTRIKLQKIVLTYLTTNLHTHTRAHIRIHPRLCIYIYIYVGQESACKIQRLQKKSIFLLISTENLFRLRSMWPLLYSTNFLA